MGRRSFGFCHAFKGSDNNSEHKADAESTDEECEVVNHLNPFG
jgi:hypothetical protein